MSWFMFFGEPVDCSSNSFKDRQEIKTYTKLNRCTASLQAGVTNSPRKCPTQRQPVSGPTAIARNMSIVKTITSDRFVNAACHPILLKLAAILFMLTTYLTNRRFCH